MGLFENPFKNHNKKEVAAAIGLTAAAAVGGSFDAATLAGAHHEAGPTKEQARQMSAQEMQKMQEPGPGGAVVSIENDQAVVHIDLSTQPTSVDLSEQEKQVTMRPPE